MDSARNEGSSAGWSSGRAPPGSHKNCHSTSDHPLSLVRRNVADGDDGFDRRTVVGAAAPGSAGRARPCAPAQAASGSRYCFQVAGIVGEAINPADPTQESLLDTPESDEEDLEP